MNIVIIEKCRKTRNMLCQLLKEDGFDDLEVFSGLNEAILQAHWNDTEMVLTATCPETAPKDPLVQWVKRFHPHITSVGHSIRSSGVISYTPLP